MVIARDWMHGSIDDRDIVCVFCGLDRLDGRLDGRSSFCCIDGKFGQLSGYYSIQGSIPVETIESTTKESTQTPTNPCQVGVEYNPSFFHCISQPVSSLSL